MMKTLNFFMPWPPKATEKNYITSIIGDGGNTYQNHEHKVAIILKSYKDRLGTSIDPPCASILKN